MNGTHTNGTSPRQAPEPATPWSELDRDVARAVARTLAGKLQRYVAPELLPLVAEELGRVYGPDGVDAGDADRSATGDREAFGAP